MKNKLFRHYKNKDYKYLGEAIHSETLEKLIYYKCLHDNDLGQYWVRPEGMFFGEIEIDGNTRPRFKNVDIRIDSTSSLNEKNVTEVVQLLDSVFGGFKGESLEDRLSKKEKILLVSAYDGEQFVGFKLGYAENDSTFYSWLGAVAESYRGIGLGKSLIEVQQSWCREMGFSTIKTKSLNRWKNMLILNLNCGFQIVGTENRSDGDIKIVFEKRIDETLS